MEHTFKRIIEEGADEGKKLHFFKRVVIFDFKGKPTKAKNLGRLATYMISRHCMTLQGGVLGTLIWTS